MATGILASSAVLGIVVGFAARQTLANAIAGILLAITQPIRIGDLVTFEDETGTVEDVRLTYTYLRSDDGRRIIIPNERLAQNTIENHTIIDPRVRVDRVACGCRRTPTRPRALRALGGDDIDVAGRRDRQGRRAARGRHLGAHATRNAAPWRQDSGRSAWKHSVVRGYPRSRTADPTRPRARRAVLRPARRRRSRPMTHRQRKLRRTKRKPHFRSKAGLGVLLLLTARDHRRAVGGRLHRRDRGDRARHRRAQADRQGRELGRSTPPTDRCSATCSPTSSARSGRGDDMPVELRQGTVAIEDERFYEHDGVDPEGIVRAAVKNVTSGSTRCRAARRSPSSSSARSTSRIRSRTSSARSARPSWPRSSRTSTPSAGSSQQYLNTVPYGTVARPHRAGRRGRVAGLLLEAAPRT